jgi:predicted nucleic acid-binding protein
VGLIYVDSCVVIYAVEDHPKWGQPSRLAFAQEGSAKLAISPLVKLECLVGPYKRNDGMEKFFEDFFTQTKTLEMPEAAYLRAAEISATFRLKTPDALHLACAQHHGCEALWTNDGRLNKASRGLARNIFA